MAPSSNIAPNAVQTGEDLVNQYLNDEAIAQDHLDSSPSPSDRRVKDLSDRSRPAAGTTKLQNGAQHLKERLEGGAESKHRGTRSVSKLSPAQLARKRANDREAQRAIRQRTKEHIESLERRIEELSDPSREVRAAWLLEQRNKELEEELMLMKQKMAQLEMQNAAFASGSMPLAVGGNASQAMNSIDEWPTLTNMPMQFNADDMAGFDPNSIGVTKADLDPNSGMVASFPNQDANMLSPYPSESPTAGAFPNLDASNLGIEPVPGQPHGFGLPNNMANPPWTNTFPSQMKDPNMFSPPNSYIGTQDMPYQYNQQPQLQNPPRTQEPRQQQQHQQPPQQLPQQPPQQPRQSLSQQQAGGVPIAPAPPRQQLQPKPQRPNNLQGSGSVSQSQPSPGSPPYWSQIPRFLPTTSLIDQLLQQALQAHRSSVIAGGPNPKNPDYTSILGLPSSQCSPLSSAISRAIQVAGFKGIATQAAVLYTTHCLLRWQTDPRPQTYQHVPSWLRPGKVQLQTPHALWVSQLIWRGLREWVAGNGGRYVRDEFVLCYARNLEIDWQTVLPPDMTHRDMAAEGGGVRLGMGPGFDEGLFEVDVSGMVVATSKFEQCIRTQESWGLRPEFLGRYSELSEMIKRAGNH